MEENDFVPRVVPRLLGHAAEIHALVRRRRRRHPYGFPGAPPDAYWEFLREPVAPPRAFPGVIPVVLHFVKRVVQLAVLLAVSVGSYLLLYRLVMPSQFEAALHFDYTTAYSPATHAPLPRRRTRPAPDCPAPWAAADLFARQSPWEARLAAVAPPPRVPPDRRRLAVRQPHFLEARLRLPRSPVNERAGMFGVVVELRAAGDGALLAVSRRSARLPHESGWIRTLRDALCLVPLLLGAWDESRTVVVPAFRHFVESAEAPLRHVVVRIEQPPPAPGAARPRAPPEVLGGEIVIGRELNALQELMKVWFYTCCVIGTGVFIVIYLIQWHILNFMWSQFRRRLEPESVAYEEDFDFTVDFENSQEELFEESHSDHGNDRNREKPIRSASSSSWENLSPGAHEVIDDDASFATPSQQMF